MPVPKPKPPTMMPRPVPLDSTYAMNMGTDAYQRANQGAGLVQANAVDQSDTAEAIRRLAMQRAQSQHNYNAGNARRGSLLSGRAMNAYGMMDTNYQQRGNDMQAQLARRLAQRQQQLGDLQGGRQPYDLTQQYGSVGRASDNAWTNRLPRYQGGIR